MAGKRIPDLDPLSGAASANDDKLVIYDASTTSTKRIDRSQLAAGLVGDLPFTPTGFVSATTVPTAVTEIVTDLAASSGASLVNFLQSGSGAVARTVQSKLREVVSLKDFGAVGDGVTDDTAAVTAWATAANGKNGYVPAGTYLVQPITIAATDELYWYGDGLTRSQFKLKASSTGAMFTLNDFLHGEIRDIGFNGDYTNNASGTHCVAITGAESGGNGYWIERCGFFNAKLDGFNEAGTYSKSRILNCIAELCQRDGISAAASNLIVLGNRIVNNGRNGILTSGYWAQIEDNTCTNNSATLTGANIKVTGAFSTISGNTVLSGGGASLVGHGIHISSATLCTLGDNYAQGNNGHGIYIESSASCNITGGFAFANNISGIEIGTASDNCMVCGVQSVTNKGPGFGISSAAAVLTGFQAKGNGTGGTATNALTGVANEPHGVSLRASAILTNLGDGKITNNVGSGANGIGLFVNAAVTGLTMSNVAFSANTSDATIIKANVSTVRDCANFSISAIGSGTIAAGATTSAITFATALLWAPENGRIRVTFNNNATTPPGLDYVTSVTASGFTLNVAVAPGGSGLGYSYAVDLF